MVLYRLKSPGEEGVNVYARNNLDIISLVNSYRERLRAEGNLDKPGLLKWVAEEPEKTGIEEVARGEMIFVTGAIDVSSEACERERGKSFFQELLVNPDFLVRINLESLPHFETMRRFLSNLRRGNLYKIQTEGIFGSLTFIPEDIAKAIEV